MIIRKELWIRKQNRGFGKPLGARAGLSHSTLVVKCLASEKSVQNVRARRILPAVVPKPLTLPKNASSMRIYVVSDLHTDYPENLEWVKGMPVDVFRQDTLIVAGDVAEKLETFETTMTLLKERFRHVFFVPGNHDLWCRDSTTKNIDSMEKLHRLLKICCRLGVETEPRVVKGVGIIPLFSWYHQSFDKERDMSGYRFPPLKLVCRDFQACRWQSPYINSGDSLAGYFDNLNTGSWELVEEIKRSAQQIISFSHFLPRLELCPEKRMLFYPNLPKVVGSDFLEARVREVHGMEGSLSACHVFGHTHFCWDATLNGIRYFQAPLAYPNERQRRINGGEDWLPFCIYNSDLGGLVEGPLPFYWSEYYRNNKRDPGNNQLAPWVSQFYKTSLDRTD